MSQLRLRRLRHRREREIDAYAEGEFEVDELAERLASIDREIAAVQSLVDSDAAQKARSLPERRRWDGAKATGAKGFVGNRIRNHPSADAIARAQRHLWRSRLASVTEALTHCWACLVSMNTEYLEKAHIRPVRWGGEDAPWNLLLLCSLCHVEQDDEASRADQLRWLREHRPFPKIFEMAKEASK